MLKNIYTPVSGALAQEHVLDMIANNLANLNTVGFKGDNVTFTLLDPEPDQYYNTPLPPANFKMDLDDVMPLRGNEMSYVGVAEMERDVSQGPAIGTNNPTDLMIEGQGYFQVNTDEGVRYSRAGNLKVSPQGALTTASGHPVMGEKGAIFVRNNRFEVNGSGEVFQDGKMVDRLMLFNAKDEKAFERVGQNYLYFGGAPEDLTRVASPHISQGFLEGSNVNAIKNLTAMIVAHRSYEAYQKAVANFDKMMEKSSNSIGEVRA